MKDFNFKLKTDMKLGVGLSKKLGNILSEKGYKKVGVVIDFGIYGNPLVTECIKNIESCMDKTLVMKSTMPEPDYVHLDNCADYFKTVDFEFDCIIGVGGGSTLDLTKGIACLLKNEGKGIEYRGFGKVKNQSVPIITVPTTAGTGSEVTPYAVFIDKTENRKLGINTDYNFPSLAVLDPELTLSCPKSVTIGSGMDALIHALESFIAKDSTHISKVFSAQGFSLVYNNISKVVDNPNDIVARSNMLLGSYYAAIGLMNSGAGVAHALGYPLGVRFNVPHGMAGSVFLSHVVNMNVAKDCHEYSMLLESMDNRHGVEFDDESLEFAFNLKVLCDELEIPKTLKGFGVKKDDVEILVGDTIKWLKPTIDQNPIPMTESDLRNMLLNMV